MARRHQQTCELAREREREIRAPWCGPARRLCAQLLRLGYTSCDEMCVAHVNSTPHSEKIKGLRTILMPKDDDFLRVGCGNVLPKMDQVLRSHWERCRGWFRSKRSHSREIAGDLFSN